MDLQQDQYEDLIARYDNIKYVKDPVCINEKLPREILLHIFSFFDVQTLTKVALVCKYWYDCAFDGSLWRDVDLFGYQTIVKKNLVDKIASHSGGFLRTLNLKGCRNLNDESVGTFTELCRHIEILDLSQCPNLTNNSVRYIGNNCQDLKVLMLESIPGLDHFGFSYLSQCRELVSLNVSWSKITDQNLVHIADGCRKLEQLRCIGCQQITSNGIIAVAKKCPNLSALNLNYCQNNITDHALVHLSINCPDLRIICLSYCSITDVGLRALAGCLNKSMVNSLFHFTLPSSDILLRYNLQVLAHQPNQITRHPTMRAPIIINGANPQQQQHQRLVFNQNNSHVINHNFVGMVTSANRQTVVRPIDQPRGCRKLKSIELAHCFSISDNGAIALTRSCPLLEKIDLEGCSLITDLTLAQISTNCPQLATLIISHCDQVTDDGIAKLTSGMCERERLINLAIDNCPLLTDTSLDYLSKKCRKLKRLDLFDCQLITQQGISNYQDLLPSIQIQAYFAPEVQSNRGSFNFRRIFQCCNLL